MATYPQEWQYPNPWPNNHKHTHARDTTERERLQEEKKVCERELGGTIQYCNLKT